MKYDHLRLLGQMLDQNVSQVRILNYFLGEGYTEKDIIQSINNYEEEIIASRSVAELPPADQDIPLLTRKQQKNVPLRHLIYATAIVLSLFITLLIVLFF